MTPAVLVALLQAAPAEVPALAERPPDVVVPAVHALALMTVMRGVETVIWPDPFARTQWFGASYERAFTTPPLFDTSKPFMQWDGDPFLVNVVGHALFGSELHVRARACRFPWAAAFAFTAASSALWEYGFEANGVRPSALDLVYTPVAGLALGEARFQLWRAAAGISSPTWRGIARAALDPLGEAERAFGTRC